MVDMVVHRHALRETIARVVRLLTRTPAVQAAAEAPALPKPATNGKAAGKGAAKAEATPPAG
jgi:acetyl-CoA carboxylase carboxyl transferase subunit beta